MTAAISPKSARSSTTRSPNSASRSRATAIAPSSRSSPSIRARVARNTAPACPPVPTVTSTNASGPCADSSPHTSSTITGTCLRSAASSSCVAARLIPHPSQTQLREKLRIHYLLFGRLQNFLQRPFVPQLKMILPRRERHLPLQPPELAQLGRNQNASLPVDGHLMRSADDQRFERHHLRIESRLGSQMRDQRIPLTRRIQRQAALSVMREIGDI